MVMGGTWRETGWSLFGDKAVSDVLLFLAAIAHQPYSVKSQMEATIVLDG